MYHSLLIWSSQRRKTCTEWDGAKVCIILPLLITKSYKASKADAFVYHQYLVRTLSTL